MERQKEPPHSFSPEAKKEGVGESCKRSSPSVPTRSASSVLSSSLLSLPELPRRRLALDIFLRLSLVSDLPPHIRGGEEFQDRPRYPSLCLVDRYGHRQHLAARRFLVNARCWPVRQCQILS